MPTLSKLFFVISILFVTNLATAWAEFEVREGIKLEDLTVYDAKGKAQRLQSTGKITLVNFWATWCAPCIAEMPSLIALMNAEEDMTVIAISEDLGPKARVEAFIKNQNWHHELQSPLFVYDNKAMLMREHKLNGLPATLLFDAKGALRALYKGPTEWNTPKLTQDIHNLIQN